MEFTRRRRSEPTDHPSSLPRRRGVPVASIRPRRSDDDSVTGGCRVTQTTATCWSNALAWVRMVCHQCGKSVQREDRFCTGCGTSLTGVTETTQVVQVVEPDPAAHAAVIADEPTELVPTIGRPSRPPRNPTAPEPVSGDADVSDGDDPWSADDPVWATTGAIPAQADPLRRRRHGGPPGDRTDHRGLAGPWQCRAGYVVADPVRLRRARPATHRPGGDRSDARIRATDPLCAGSTAGFEWGPSA